MKTSNIPAQITTVEDKITGNLSFKQLLILVAAICSDFLIFIVVPRPLKISALKVAICCAVTALISSLAYKHDGRLLYSWARLIYRFNSRPRFYVYNKNDLSFRPNFDTKQRAIENQESVVEDKPMEDIKYSLESLNKLSLEEYIEIKFSRDKKAGLKAYVSQVK
ncbi:MAG TPA: PrgI family protein [Candidatus Sulfotelmatobacter sp.]|nr:PrgI family protein [Candidatus Sulfotelmatobacter sp.]